MPEEDWYIPDYLEPDEEEECEIDGLIAIFCDACEKDKGRTCYPYGAGISRLEMYIRECIAECYDSNKCFVEDWKEALKEAKEV